MPGEYWDHYEGAQAFAVELTGNLAGKPFSLDFTYVAVDTGTTDIYAGPQDADKINVRIRDFVVQAMQPCLHNSTKLTRLFTFDVLNDTNWDELNFVTTGSFGGGQPMAIWNCYHFQFTGETYGVHKGSKALPGVPEDVINNQTVDGDITDPTTPLGKLHTLAGKMYRVEDVDSGAYDMLACVMRTKKFPILQPDGSTKMLYRPWKIDKALSCTFFKYGHNTGRG